MKSKNLKKIKKSMRFKVLLLLSLLLAFNTFAWFIYSSTISTSVKGYVKSWKISFENENEAVQYFDIDIKDLYPGMNEFKKEIKVINYSDTQAEVNYEIEKLKILNKTYTSNDFSSNRLFEILNNNPFNIKFHYNKTLLEPEYDFAIFTAEAFWPYEQNNDEADTIWGHNSYEFKKNNPDKSEFEITLKLTAKQIN